jgi:hypothetical protein
MNFLVQSTKYSTDIVGIQYGRIPPNFVCCAHILSRYLKQIQVHPLAAFHKYSHRFYHKSAWKIFAITCWSLPIIGCTVQEEFDMKHFDEYGLHYSHICLSAV